MSKPKIYKAKASAVKHGTYKFTEEELRGKGIEMAANHRKKNELNDKLKEIKSEFKNKTDKLDTEINKISNDISTGERTDDFDCILYIEERMGNWVKVYESKEHGHEIVSEPFDYNKDKHLFEFSETRDDDNGVKQIKDEDGNVIMTVPYTEAERQTRLEGTGFDPDAEKTLEKFKTIHKGGKQEVDPSTDPDQLADHLENLEDDEDEIVEEDEIDEEE